jgi:hypothetical protein
MRPLLAMIAAGVLALTGCGEADRPEPEARRAESGDVASDARPGGATTSGGTIEVVVRYAGEPATETVRVLKDPGECGEAQRIEKIVVGPDHGLKDAVVSVPSVDGAGASPPAATPALDQDGCRFQPRVLAMTPGELRVLNSDDVLHNIHTESEANPPVNKAQPRFRKEIRVAFEEPEIIRARCDVHPWMEAWVAVQPSPRFAVTGATGTARIENVPSGRQTVEVWHPALGRQSGPVEVRTGETSTVTIEMTSGTS